jgi:putative DNA primase/helicase
VSQDTPIPERRVVTPDGSKAGDSITSISDGIDIFFVLGTEIEIRILKTPKGTVSGYFDALDLALRAVEKAAATLTGNSTFYATLNPVMQQVHARAANRLKPYADVTTHDDEILRRRYLMVDCDPIRPAGVSSTAVELARALERRNEVVDWLSTQGWPAPVRAMSGNGGHALYRIDLANDASARDLVKACLGTLHQRFQDSTVSIDRSVFNAGRICKLYGTVTRKGDATADRPHRRAEIEDRPILEVVTDSQLHALGGRYTAAAGSPTSRLHPSNAARLDMRNEFNARGWYVRELRSGWHAVRCPWIDAHSVTSGDTETAIHEPDTPQGLWGFKCQHNSCARRSIRDVWELFRSPESDRSSPHASANDKPVTESRSTSQPTSPDATKDDRAGEAGGLVPLGEHDPDSGRLVLSPRRTLPTARAYVQAFHHHAEGRLLHSHAARLLEWHGNQYREVEDAAISCRLQEWLHRALRYIFDRRTGTLRLTDFESNPSTVKQALDSIRTYVYLPATVVSPSWLDHRTHPPALEILPCKSMSVHIPTGEVLSATPALFTTNALEFDLDANAGTPTTWFGFMEQLWPGDAESVSLLQEWFGHCLIADTSQQKMLLLVGPRRSGKGTLGRILTRLVGSANVVGPTCSSLAGTFGLQPLIGKSLAIVSDARFTGEHSGVVVERLLCVSGEDSLTIDRKFLGAITIKLPTRFVFLTNELPRFTDASTALAGRFLILQLARSFFGEEDPTLTDRLTTELPGILLWAIAGWIRLNARGHFVQPSSGEDAIQDLEDLASPTRPFVREWCTTLPELRVAVDTLYAAWEMWCKQNGRQVGTKQMFGRDLKTAVPGIRRRRSTDSVPFYEGIALTSTTAEALDRCHRPRGRAEESDGNCRD